MCCVAVFKLTVHKPAQLHTQSEAVVCLRARQHPAAQEILRGRCSCCCGPADISLSSLIGLGLQDLTVPPDLCVQGLRRLGRRLRLLGWSWPLKRDAFLRCTVICLVRPAACWLLLMAYCPGSDAMPPTLLCQSDGCRWALALRTEPHPRLPTRLSQHLAPERCGQCYC